MGSRYKNTCKSCNREWILEACVKNNFYDEIGWIPVSATCNDRKKVNCNDKGNAGMTPRGLL